MNKFRLANLVLNVGWTGNANEVNKHLLEGQNNYITQQLRLLWQIFPFNYIAYPFIKLIFTAPDIEYYDLPDADYSSIRITQKVAVIGLNKVAAYIFLKYPMVLPQLEECCKA